MKRLVAVLLLAVSGVAMTSSPCWACSCAGATKKEHAQGADGVFYGKVVNIDYPEPNPEGGTSGGGVVRVKFWVQTVYKGKNVERTTVVRTENQGSGCGYAFQEGERYTVFGERKKGGRYTTNLCMGTKERDIDPDNYGLPDGWEPEN